MGLIQDLDFSAGISVGSGQGCEDEPFIPKGLGYLARGRKVRV